MARGVQVLGQFLLRIAAALANGPHLLGSGRSFTMRFWRVLLPIRIRFFAHRRMVPPVTHFGKVAPCRHTVRMQPTVFSAVLTTHFAADKQPTGHLSAQMCRAPDSELLAQLALDVYATVLRRDRRPSGHSSLAVDHCGRVGAGRSGN